MLEQLRCPLAVRLRLLLLVAVLLRLMRLLLPLPLLLLSAWPLLPQWPLLVRSPPHETEGRREPGQQVSPTECLERLRCLLAVRLRLLLLVALLLRLMRLLQQQQQLLLLPLLLQSPLLLVRSPPHEGRREAAQQQASPTNLLAFLANAGPDKRRSSTLPRWETLGQRASQSRGCHISRISRHPWGRWATGPSERPHQWWPRP